MKNYIKTFESFRNEEPVNEEFLGAIGKWLGNMFKKAQENIRKTEGGNEIEVIYKKYLGMINDSFQKQANVNLNLGVAIEGDKAKEAKAKEDKSGESKPVAKVEGDVEAQTENLKINESTPYSEEDVKMSSDTLKEKKAVMDQIVEKMKTIALKEMDNVLKKHGGSSKNPKLQIIIDVKKSQFDLDYMNAKISYLEAAGDENMKKIVEKERDNVAKIIAGEWKKFDKPVEKNSILLLNWGDVEIELELPVEGGTTRYRIIKSNSKKLTLGDNTLFCDISGEAKKGETVELTRLSTAGKGGVSAAKFEIDGNDSYTTGKLQKILMDGKEVDNYKFNGNYSGDPKDKETKEETTEDKSNKLMDKEQEEAKAAGKKAKADRALEDETKKEGTK